VKHGIVEKRQHERVQVDLKAAYQLLSEEKAREIQLNPAYLGQPERHAGNFFKTGTENLSQGGMALVGTDQFQAGMKVLIRFEVPKAQVELTCLAEVRWVEPFEEMKRPMCRAGLKFLALKRDDVLMLNEYLKYRGVDVKSL
jgi:c-di-GMP-binding flagellar brake protein YcgR